MARRTILSFFLFLLFSQNKKLGFSEIESSLVLIRGERNCIKSDLLSRTLDKKNERREKERNEFKARKTARDLLSFTVFPLLH